MLYEDDEEEDVEEGDVFRAGWGELLLGLPNAGDDEDTRDCCRRSKEGLVGTGVGTARLVAAELPTRVIQRRTPVMWCSIQAFEMLDLSRHDRSACRRTGCCSELVSEGVGEVDGDL